MASQWNEAKQQYEVYSTLEGAMVPTGKDSITLHDELQQMMREGTWCGTCKQSECLVDSGRVCCHDVVVYGFCMHVPLPL